jgi:Protein of unknown function (DUF4232)
MTAPALATRAVLAAALLACGAGLLTACGSSAGGSSAQSTVTVTATPSGATSPAADGTGGVGGTGGASAANGPASCATSALHVDLGQGNGAAGSTYVPIHFTNQSSTACTMYGFPGVSFVTGVGGSQIGASAGEDTSTARRVVTLAPGGKATAVLRIVVAQNFPTAKCKPVTTHWLKVYPPGQTAALYVKFTSAACSSTSTAVRVLGVQTVLPGAGGA